MLSIYFFLDSQPDGVVPKWRLLDFMKALEQNFKVDLSYDVFHVLDYKLDEVWDESWSIYFYDPKCTQDPRIFVPDLSIEDIVQLDHCFWDSLWFTMCQRLGLNPSNCEINWGVYGNHYYDILTQKLKRWLRPYAIQIDKENSMVNTLRFES